MESVPKLAGKTVVITGATAGIGLAVLKKFAASGALVIGVGRASEKCMLALNDVRQSVKDAKAHYLLADLAKLTDVRRLGSEIKTLLAQEGYNNLDILVNNAGTYADHFQLTADGLETTLAVNHFAGFLLSHECMPLLRQSSDTLILTTSSNSHYRTSLRIAQINKPSGYRFGLWAYKVSKLMNVLFTYEFNRRYQNTNIKAFAVDPGLVNTNIGFKNTAWHSQFVWNIRHRRGMPPEVPAETFYHLAVNRSIRQANVYYWKDCQPKQPNRLAFNTHLGEELWQVSRAFCRIESEF